VESLYKKALKFAYQAHHGQTRKFSGDPYIFHPIRVANLVAMFIQDSSTEYYQAVALLHDTIEDCNVCAVDLENVYRGISSDVLYLTKLPKYPNENRKMFLTRNNAVLAGAPHSVRIVKLCDRIDNIMDIPVSEMKNMQYYLEEGDALLEAICHGLPKDLIDTYFAIRQDANDAL
jgi:(p)ppGpp synthase/HD superfamily hydrolase